MRRLLVNALIILCFFPQVLLAQTSNSIHGRITDKLQKPVVYANASLINLKDSVIAQTIAADKKGEYNFANFTNGKYLICITATGFVNDTIKINHSQSDTSYNIQLDLKSHELNEVIVTSKKPFVQVRPDKVILNVASSINATGSSIFDLLRKAPGVKTMGEESISINGKNGLAVYMDGNKINLDGKDLIDYLQSLTSTNIETIEIITNPSAKYDAAGNGGIINIKTKKNTALGFNGNISAGSNFSDYKPKYNAATNLNYRQKGFNLYGNYSWLSANYKITQDLLKIQLDKNAIPTTFDQHYLSKFIRDTYTYKIGADLFLSPKSTLGIMVDGNIYENNPTRTSTTFIFQNKAKIDSVLTAKTVQPKHSNNSNYNINYRYRDSTGKELTLNANYGTYKSNSKANLNNNYETNTGILLRQSNSAFNTITNINIQSINADYQQKIWDGNFSTGAKYSQVNSDNNLVSYNVNNNISTLDSGQSNQFIYKEKVAAAYLDYSFTAKKWQFQLGARVENTSSNGKLNSAANKNVQAVDTNYTNLFPNFIVEYKLNETHSFGLIYNKRIDRPDYQDLNPFKFILDDLFYLQGNPFLKPQFTSEIKLSHTLKQRFTTSISYDNIKDNILKFRDTIDGGKTHQSNENFHQKQLVTLRTSAQLTLKNYWDLFYDAGITHEQYNGQLGNAYLNMSQTNWDISVTNTFNLKKKWMIELSGYYYSKYVDAPAFVSPQWSVDVGIQKKILADAAVLRISITDLFNSDKYDYNRNFGGLFFINHNKVETRLLKLSINYKFGNLKVKAPSKKSSGAEDEQSRIKNGQ